MEEKAEAHGEETLGTQGETPWSGFAHGGTQGRGRKRAASLVLDGSSPRSTIHPPRSPRDPVLPSTTTSTQQRPQPTTMTVAPSHISANARPAAQNGVTRDVEQELARQRAEKRRQSGGASPVQFHKDLLVG